MYEEKIIPNHTVADLFGNILHFGIGFFIDSITELLKAYLFMTDF